MGRDEFSTGQKCDLCAQSAVCGKFDSYLEIKMPASRAGKSQAKKR
jgi:hypothetical protein